jgi:hypothetical protein
VRSRPASAGSPRSGLESHEKPSGVSGSAFLLEGAGEYEPASADATPAEGSSEPSSGTGRRASEKRVEALARIAPVRERADCGSSLRAFHAALTSSAPPSATPAMRSSRRPANSSRRGARERDRAEPRGGCDHGPPEGRSDSFSGEPYERFAGGVAPLLGGRVELNVCSREGRRQYGARLRGASACHSHATNAAARAVASVARRVSGCSSRWMAALREGEDSRPSTRIGSTTQAAKLKTLYPRQSAPL